MTHMPEQLSAQVSDPIGTVDSRSASGGIRLPIWLCLLRSPRVAGRWQSPGFSNERKLERLASDMTGIWSPPSPASPKAWHPGVSKAYKLGSGQLSAVGCLDSSGLGSSMSRHSAASLAEAVRRSAARLDGADPPLSQHANVQVG